MLGTVAYMSPEQVKTKELDARTNLFSFGAVLYEMATGRMPFDGESSGEICGAILRDEPVPPVQLNQHVSPGLEAIIYIAIVVAGSLYWRSRRTFKLTQKDTIVLAHVVNNTGDTVIDDALDYPLFGKVAESPFVTVLYPSKVVDTLRLMKVSNISYIYAPQKTPKLTPELARELCVRSGSRAFVTASIANTGNAHNIALKALDCHSGKTMAKVERQTSDRNQIVKTLGAAGYELRRELGEPEDSLTRFNAPVENDTSWSLEALQALSQARRLKFEQSNAAAIPQYKRAVELDPNLAMAHLNLAGTYADSGETSSMMPYATKAFALRERLSQRTRW
jgi:serine/threonine protein kinase